ncbi:MAG: transposase [Clostridia bacterium]|nr:transposase [Clostridia bacterium]
MAFHNRKPTRKRDFDYAQDGSYFVTICSNARKNLFSNIPNKQDLESAAVCLSSIGEVAEKHIKQIHERFPHTTVDAYVIMPNHIHLLISIINRDNTPPKKLSVVIGTFKSLVSCECKRKYNSNAIFQTSFHDRIIRDSDEYEKVLNYIIHNPGNWLFDCFYAE